ncbi:NAD-dependent epimerase/dehydratase family protein [Aspergillus puulaauensis]|uniref:Putative secondary metabolism biosynthetic enzyme n=1 Tax=Aspergillus puulaauensis TaxID=1220207 RepID=A0A7R8AGT1_9EURO|nr:putative secondary metabolism biosynthetic enzyme [Aspergillus puulaauensis]BCS17697.1 putative secondary metabolism biosynthetic enzyme [Aspergillus puulaauensis]
MTPVCNSRWSSSSSLEPMFDLSSSDTDPDWAFENVSPPLGDGEDAQYVLVTGGLGYIGSHTCLELLKAGYNVLIVDDLSNSHYHVFHQILKAAQAHYSRAQTVCPKATLSIIDCGDISAMRDLVNAYSLGPTAPGKSRSRIIGVIHFAAFKQVEESIRKPLKYYQNNISGLLGLLSFLEEYNIRTFIFSSSANVYGSQAAAGQLLREEDCLHEAETPHPPKSTLSEITNTYGRTKLFGEAILADLARGDPSWGIVALRYFNPIGGDASGLLGEDPKTPSTALAAAMGRVITGQSQKLYIYGNDWNTRDGTPIRDFIHVSDLARGHIAALAAASERGVKENFRTFNLGTGSGYSVLEFLHTLEAVSRKSISYRIVGRRPGDVMSSVANTERAARELGWCTELSLVDACVDLWNYLDKKNLLG